MVTKWIPANSVLIRKLLEFGSSCRVMNVTIFLGKFVDAPGSGDATAFVVWNKGTISNGKGRGGGDC